MFKKIITYQRLLLNSTPSMGANSQNPIKGSIFVFVILVMTFLTTFIFSGKTSSTSDFLPIALPFVSVWMINRILYSGHKLFETVPVTRKYIFLSILLLSIVIILVGYLIVGIFNIVLFGLIFGIAYLVMHFHGLTQSPPPTSAVHQIINTTKGDMFMLLILILILSVGIAITFIKAKKLRLSSFAGFTAIGYGLLLSLKLNMPISPNSSKVEFLESFSVMPQANTILFYLAIATIIICIGSVIMGYKLYVGKSNTKAPFF